MIVVFSMKYLLVLVLSLIPLRGLSQEAYKDALPESVKQVSEMRIKVTVELDNGSKETFMLLVPKDGVSFERLKSVIAKAGVPVAGDATRKNAKENGGWQIFKSLFNGNFVLVPLK